MRIRCRQLLRAITIDAHLNRWWLELRGCTLGQLAHRLELLERIAARAFLGGRRLCRDARFLCGYSRGKPGEQHDAEDQHGRNHVTNFQFVVHLVSSYSKPRIRRYYFGATAWLTAAGCAACGVLGWPGCWAVFCFCSFSLET